MVQKADTLLTKIQKFEEELAKYVDELPEYVQGKLPRIAFASWQLDLWRSMRAKSCRFWIPTN